MPPIRTRAEREADLELMNPEDIIEANSQIGGESSKVIIYKESQERLNDFAYLTEMLAEDFSLGDIQKRYKGGRYKAAFFNKEGTLVRNNSFSIADVEEETPSGDLEMKMMMRQMLREREGNGRTRESLQSNDSTTQILLPIILKLLENKGPDVVALLTAFAAINGKGGSGLDPIQVMEQMRLERESGLKLGQTIGEAGGDGGSFAKTALQELSPAIMAIASNLMNKNTPAVGSPVVPQQQIPAQTVAPHLIWLLPLQSYLPMLIDKAKKGKNPEVFAALLIEEMTPDQLEKLEASSKAPGFVEDVLVAIPQFQDPALQQWGRMFLTNLKEHFVEDLEDETVESSSVQAAMDRQKAKAVQNAAE